MRLPPGKPLVAAGKALRAGEGAYAPGLVSDCRPCTAVVLGPASVQGAIAVVGPVNELGAFASMGRNGILRAMCGGFVARSARRRWAVPRLPGAVAQSKGLSCLRSRKILFLCLWRAHKKTPYRCGRYGVGWIMTAYGRMCLSSSRIRASSAMM